MITLALDLAGRTGWAIRYDTGEIRVGIWTLTRGNIGGNMSSVPMVRLWKRLNKLSETHEIERIIFENTYAQGMARFRLDSLQYTALLYAVLNGIFWVRVSPTAWKKSVVGSGKVSREAYFAFAKEKWPEINFKTDDEAAARCLLEFWEKGGDE